MFVYIFLFLLSLSFRFRRQAISRNNVAPPFVFLLSPGVR